MRTLERRLGAVDGAAIVVCNVIGGGIFFVPPIVAGLVGDPAAILGVWAIGAVLAFCGAMAYAELGAMFPRSGGEYVYLREAFGPLAGFLSGWTSCVAGFPGAMAASALALADAAGTFVPTLAVASPAFVVQLPGFPIAVSNRSATALAIVFAMAAIHIRGVSEGRRVQNALALVKVLALAAFVVCGLTWPVGPRAVHGADSAASASNVFLAILPVMFAYSGWNAATYVAEEIRAPGRNVPRALAIGLAIVAVLYLALNAVFLRAVSPAELTALTGGTLPGAIAGHIFESGSSFLVAAFAIVSLAASISAMTIAGPRVYYAMARDGLFFSAAARVHPGLGTPVASIAAQALWTAVLILSGTLAGIVVYTGFAITLFAAGAVAALVVLRRRAPDAGRPFRAWGYPWTPLVFVATSAFMVLAELSRARGAAWAGLAIVAAGVPIHFLMTRRAQGTFATVVPSRSAV